MNKLLLVIDMQKEFINDNTKFLIEKITKLIEENEYDNVVFTKFVNNDKSIFYTRLKYDGCISDERRQIVLPINNKTIIEKTGYSALTEELISYIKNKNIDEIYLCGIDTEACILKSALDMFENGFNVYVLKDYCASTCGSKRHDNAIRILERNIGKEYII